MKTDEDGVQQCCDVTRRDLVIHLLSFPQHLLSGQLVSIISIYAIWTI